MNSGYLRHQLRLAAASVMWTAFSFFVSCGATAQAAAPDRNQLMEDVRVLSSIAMLHF